MSGYISSYLIEPVVRQARRLSRSNHPVTPPLPRLLSESHEDSATLDDEKIPSQPAPTMETDLGAGPAHRIHATPDLPLSGEVGAYSNAPLVESPRQELDELDVQRTDSLSRLQSTTSAPPRTSSIHYGNGDTTYNSQPDFETTDNPAYGVPDRFVPTALTMASSSSTSATNVAAAEDAIDPTGDRSRQNTRHDAPNPSTHTQNGPLPADDGMAGLRARIIEIQQMGVSGADQARLMHQLMTAQYQLSQEKLPPPLMTSPHSPASLHGHERPNTPSSMKMDYVNHRPMTPTSMTSTFKEGSQAFNLTAEDLKPTYAPLPKPTPVAGDETEQESVASIDEFEFELPLGCKHYRRNVKLQCYSCNKWYTCRFCHDEVETHKLVRKETKNMLCMMCSCAQTAGETCVDCGERSARYYCDVCKLWDDDNERSIYHCIDCGICRIGQGLGMDFFHCKTCGVCISISHADTHKCIERSTDCDCPICGEYLFTSPDAVVFMNCGHSIHKKCFTEYMKTSYRCPICSRTVVNMEIQFRHLDRDIQSQPMPPEFQETRALIYCNDCRAKCETKYHWLGLRCVICDSYNTAQLRILRHSLEGPTPDILLNEVIPGGEGPEMIAEPARGRRAEAVTPIPRTVTSSPARRPTSSPMADVADSQHAAPRPWRPSRSISPMRGVDLTGLVAATTTGSESLLLQDDGEDDLDFWGGEDRSPRSSHMPPARPITTADLSTLAAEEEEADGVDSESDDDPDDDDGDDEDDVTEDDESNMRESFELIDLPGHR